MVKLSFKSEVTFQILRLHLEYTYFKILFNLVRSADNLV